MDPVSIGVLILLGAAAVWMIVRAQVNSKHSPPTRIRGGISGAARTDDQVSQMGVWTDPEPPDPGQDHPGSGSPRR